METFDMSKERNLVRTIGLHLCVKPLKDLQNIQITGELSITQLKLIKSKKKENSDQRSEFLMTKK